LLGLITEATCPYSTTGFFISMKFTNRKFRSISEIAKAFPTEEKCIAHLEALQWPLFVYSPFDYLSSVYRCGNGKYKCKNTGKYFTVKTNTLFHNTRVPLLKWFQAIYLLDKTPSMTSVQLGEKIGLNQRTAWLLKSKIEAMTISHEST